MTLNQISTLVWFAGYVQRHQVSPSVQDCADHFKLSHTGGEKRMNALRSQGVIAKPDRERRAFVLTPSGRAAVDRFWHYCESDATTAWVLNEIHNPTPPEESHRTPVVLAA